MRSFVRLPARVARHGLGVVLLAASTLTTACELITGIPDVKRVELSIAPPTVSIGAQAQANGVAIGKNGNPVTSSRVHVAYATSNPQVASINQTSGAIVGVSEGTAEITASSRGKSAKATVTVTAARVISARTIENPVIVEIGKSIQIHFELRDPIGNALTNRAVTVTSSAPLIASVAGTNTSNIVVTGNAIGSTTLNGTVDVAGFSVPVSVTPIKATSLDLSLQKGGNKLLVGEQTQLVLTFKDAGGNPLPTLGRTWSYQIADQTVATISASGVLTGTKPGTTTITVVESGTGIQKTFNLTVDYAPVKLLTYAPINPVFRKGAPRSAAALALDSANNIINRPIAYTSSNPGVLAVDPNSGLATPLSVGTATITATVDGKSAQLDARVTIIPIGKVVVTPVTTTVFPGQTAQYTATVTDSLNNVVTDRRPTWSSTNSQVATVDANTGLATATGPGVATINALIELVPGEGFSTGSGGQIVVNATRVDTVTVSASDVTIRAGTTQAVTIIARDAAGNQLFGRTIVATSDDAAVAIAQVGGNGTTLGIQGIGTGSTKIRLQAVNSSGIPEGKVTIINVTVQ